MTPLTDEQMREAALIISVGCDRDTAAKYVGCTVEQLSDHAIREPRFAEDLRRAEAGCEVAHMRNIQQASKEDRHWRASVWWLERRLPERYGKREADTIGPRGAAKSTVATLAGVLRSALEGDERYLWIVSDTKAQAHAHLENVKTELVENRSLADAYPRSCGRGPRWRAGGIELRSGVVIDAYRHAAHRTFNATEVGYAAAGSQSTTVAANPLGNYRVEESRLAYRRIIASGEAPADAKKWWFLGDFRKAFAYMENWPITVTQAPLGSEAEFTNDVVLRFKASERGAAAVINPRYVVKSTG